MLDSSRGRFSINKVKGMTSGCQVKPNCQGARGEGWPKERRERHKNKRKKKKGGLHTPPPKYTSNAHLPRVPLLKVN